ncbi:MAG: hypothetical protein LBI39_02140 [Puniceicoccales bacterium]|jgi:hypothetical protein|nr:hypothetical protein [Puniceicoccales bacterium]
MSVDSLTTSECVSIATFAPSLTGKSRLYLLDATANCDAKTKAFAAGVLSWSQITLAIAISLISFGFVWIFLYYSTKAKAANANSPVSQVLGALNSPATEKRQRTAEDLALEILRPACNGLIGKGCICETMVEAFMRNHPTNVNVDPNCGRIYGSPAHLLASRRDEDLDAYGEFLIGVLNRKELPIKFRGSGEVDRTKFIELLSAVRPYAVKAQGCVRELWEDAGTFPPADIDGKAYEFVINESEKIFKQISDGELGNLLTASLAKITFDARWPKFDLNIFFDRIRLLAHPLGLSLIRCARGAAADGASILPAISTDSGTTSLAMRIMLAIKTTFEAASPSAHAPGAAIAAISETVCPVILSWMESLSGRILASEVRTDNGEFVTLQQYINCKLLDESAIIGHLNAIDSHSDEYRKIVTAAAKQKIPTAGEKAVVPACPPPSIFRRLFCRRGNATTYPLSSCDLALRMALTAITLGIVWLVALILPKKRSPAAVAGSAPAANSPPGATDWSLPPQVAEIHNLETSVEKFFRSVNGHAPTFAIISLGIGEQLERGTFWQRGSDGILRSIYESFLIGGPDDKREPNAVAHDFISFINQYSHHGVTAISLADDTSWTASNCAEWNGCVEAAMVIPEMSTLAWFYNGAILKVAAKKLHVRNGARRTLGDIHSKSTTPTIAKDEFAEKIKLTLVPSGQAAEAVGKAVSECRGITVEKFMSLIAGCFIGAYDAIVRNGPMKFTAIATAVRLGAGADGMLATDKLTKYIYGEIEKLMSARKKIDGDSIRDWLRKFLPPKTIEQLMLDAIEIATFPFECESGWQNKKITELADEIVAESPNDSEEIKWWQAVAKSAISQFMGLKGKHKIPIETIP